jgi:hypothetical protein
MGHTYRYDKHRDDTKTGKFKAKTRYKTSAATDNTRNFSLPAFVAQQLLIKVLHRNSRAFLLQNPLNNAAILHRPQDNLNYLINGETHFGKNFSYLAGHISQTHSLIKGKNGELSLFKGREKGVFYLLDKRNYLEKISNPTTTAKNIVHSFMNLPIEACRVKAYDPPHLTHVGTRLDMPEGEIKEFTHKITLIKDFTNLDVTLLQDKKLMNENLPSKLIPLRGVGLAMDKKDKEENALPSLQTLEPATQVTMVIQITKEFYRELFFQKINESFNLECLPWRGNAYVLTMFPVIKDLSCSHGYH